MIWYSDVDVSPEHFSGEGAEETARKRFVQARDHWTVRLFRCVDQSGYGPLQRRKEISMRESQEPKYDAINGQIVNRATGNPIPDDEPIFILRAKDIRAVGALKRYQQFCTDTEHRAVVGKRIVDFESFARTHYDRMKEPDTRVAAEKEPPREVPEVPDDRWIKHSDEKEAGHE